MQSLDTHVINQTARWIKYQPLWFCTVLSTFGSSPRPPGAMMVINGEGDFCGSLSGGCVEDDFIDRIQKGFFRQPSQIVRYGEQGLAPDKALPCGGVLDILIEYLEPVAANIGYVAEIEKSLRQHTTMKKHISPPEACHLLTPAAWSSNTNVERKDEEIIITLASSPAIIIAGLSTVAVYCAEFALGLGFETVICEPREEVIASFKDRLGEQVRIECTFPALYLEQNGCHANTAIVALTHDPRMDDLTMMEAVNTDSFYIGVMGSRKTTENRIARLKSFGGLNHDEINRIHAPIGLDIGSKTPAEIALAIMADIVKIKNNNSRDPSLNNAV